MPIYCYEPVGDGCDDCRDGLEILQGINDEPIGACPTCGGAVTKAITTFRPGASNILSNSNLKEKGFAKLKKTSDGTYEREV